MAGVEESDLLKSDDNSLAARIKREADVLLLGAATGYLEAANDRFSNHKIQTASELGISAAVSYGLVRATHSGAPVRYAMAVTGAALTFSFVKNVLFDMSDSFSQLKEVVTDSWESGNKLDSNKTKVANLVGPFLFDTTLALSGGMAGGRLASKHLSERSLLSSMEEKYGQQIRESVYTAQSSPINDRRFYGSAYAVQNDKLATAFHVVKDDPTRPWTLLQSNEKLHVNVLAAHPYFDLALFKTTSGGKLSPLPLATLSERSTTVGVIVGSPGGLGISMKPAKFREGVFPYGVQYNTVNGRESVNSIVTAVHGGSGRPGMSGGPAMSATGEVIGTLSTIYPAGKLFGAGTLSVSSQALSSLLKLVEKSQNSKVNFSTKEAAAKLKLTETAVINKLRDAKLPGFLVPESNARWEWRVILD